MNDPVIMLRRLRSGCGFSRKHLVRADYTAGYAVNEGNRIRVKRTARDGYLNIVNPAGVLAFILKIVFLIFPAKYILALGFNLKALPRPVRFARNYPVRNPVYGEAQPVPSRFRAYLPDKLHE